MAGGGGANSSVDNVRLLYGPTWGIALACFVFILCSLLIERAIFAIGRTLKKHKKKDLEEALEKIKEELMLVGFISLALTVGQESFSKICVPSPWVNIMHQCNNATITDEIKAIDYGTCKAGKSPFISITALHQLHIFLFILALVHVFICIATMAIARWKVKMWKAWEERSLEKEEMVSRNPNIRLSKETTFVQGRLWTRNVILAYVHAFFRMFFNALSESDYQTLRHGFIKCHMSTPQAAFNFHNYMMRTLEVDFKYVVGVSPILWGYSIFLMLVNIDGWETYLWTSILPVVLVLIIGTKLERIITKMAAELTNKTAVTIGLPNVMLSDELFWFKRPQLIIKFIHFILFQNAIAISTHLWGTFTFKEDSHSCVFRSKISIGVSLALGIVSLIICGYITLPIYALVSQMGSNFKSTIFEEHVHAAIMKWRRRVGNHNEMEA